MTPEDRANEIVWRLVACAVVHARANTSDDVWHPDGLRDAIAAAVREAVAAERGTILNQICPKCRQAVGGGDDTNRKILGEGQKD